VNERAVVDSSPLFISSTADRRAAAHRAEEERVLARQRALDSQSAWDAAPHERIRRWERLHALTLPTAAVHPLVDIIAAHTKLSLDDITEEQQRRRALKETVVRPEAL
jgi:hypothetical protein